MESPTPPPPPPPPLDHHHHHHQSAAERSEIALVGILAPCCRFGAPLFGVRLGGGICPLALLSGAIFASAIIVNIHSKRGYKVKSPITSNRPYLSTARDQILSNPLQIPASPVGGGGGGGGGGYRMSFITTATLILSYEIISDYTLYGKLNVTLDRCIAR